MLSKVSDTWPEHRHHEHESRLTGFAYQDLAHLLDRHSSAQGKSGRRLHFRFIHVLGNYAVI